MVKRYEDNLLKKKMNAEKRTIEEILEEIDNDIKILSKFYDLTHKVLDDNVKLIFNTKQLAIQELEKVKEFNKQLVFSNKVIDNFIDQQIKKIKCEK